MKLVFAFLGVFLVSFGFSQGTIQDGVVGSSVPSIETALTATKFSFGKSESGKSFIVKFSNSGKERTCYVGSTPSALTSFTMYSIYTTVYSAPDGAAPSSEIMEKIFYKARKYGSYYLFKDANGRYAVRFGMSFNAGTLSPTPTEEDPAVKNLKDILYFVNQVAEETVKELNNAELTDLRAR